MSNEVLKENQPDLKMDRTAQLFSRRKFFGILGTGTALVLTAAACKKKLPFPGRSHNGNGGINLGNGDIGILNYAYSLERLEAMKPFFKWALS